MAKSDKTIRDALHFVKDNVTSPDPLGSFMAGQMLDFIELNLDQGKKLDDQMEIP